MPEFWIVVSIVLQSLLFGLYYWNHLLRNTMRILTTYLIATGKSGWEADWKEFRSRGQLTVYTKPQAFVFMALDAFAFAFPFILAWLFSINVCSAGILQISLASLATFLAIEVVIVATGFFGWRDNEDAIAQRWTEIASANDQHKP
jgi:hypothetical protein